MQKFFQSDAGLLLLARTLTAGRNSYGTMSEDLETLLADFSAYIVALLLDDHTTWGRNYTMYQPDTDEEFHNLQRSISPSTMRHLRALASRGDRQRFLDSATMFCDCRRLFLTLNGFVGLGPDTMREGDLVCILAGGDLPFVLRPLKKGLGSETAELSTISDRYLFVGECYVEGLMKGEAIVALKSKIHLAGPVESGLIVKEIYDDAGNQVLERNPISRLQQLLENWRATTLANCDQMIQGEHGSRSGWQVSLMQLLVSLTAKGIWLAVPLIAACHSVVTLIFRITIYNRDSKIFLEKQLFDIR
jgi:hypothetical protein